MCHICILHMPCTSTSRTCDVSMYICIDSCSTRYITSFLTPRDFNTHFKHTWYTEHPSRPRERAFRSPRTPRADNPCRRMLRGHYTTERTPPTLGGMRHNPQDLHTHHNKLGCLEASEKREANHFYIYPTLAPNQRRRFRRWQANANSVRVPRRGREPPSLYIINKSTS
jgi:hypothetical protein